MRNVCELLGIDKLRTTAYWYKPSTNQVECLHRTLNSILAKTVDKNHRYWNSWLSHATAAYCASGHDSTGYTPNYLVLGRESKMSVDIVYETHCEEEEPTYYDGYVDRYVADAYADARTSLKKAAETQKKYYHLRVRLTTFISDTFKGSKWIRKY